MPDKDTGAPAGTGQTPLQTLDAQCDAPSPDAQVQDEIWTRAKTAEFLGLSQQWLNTKNGKSLPRIRVGAVTRYRRSTVLRWLAERERAQ